jgi:diaminopropionate ammonia-lyase
VAAIAGEGGVVVKVDGSYDDAVRIMQAEAATNQWTVVSDTAWEGYERIPRLIMLGYTHMLDEVAEQGSGIGDQGSVGAGAGAFDAIFVQGGVGGLLCAMASWCAFHRSDPHPRVVAVEPTSAACLQASARAGTPVAVTGPLTTTMAGLRNREVSPPAFLSLLPNVDAFMAIDDCWSNEAMRALGRPRGDDPAIAAGSSGAAAVGGLLALCRDVSLSEARARLGLSSSSRVLAIVSEGVTDPEVWRTAIAGA